MKKQQWILCPICGSKTRDRIRQDTILRNYPLYCPKCKQETLIEAKNLKITVITEPLRFFFCRFLSDCAAGLFLGVYQRKQRLCGTII